MGCFLFGAEKRKFVAKGNKVSRRCGKIAVLSKKQVQRRSREPPRIQSHPQSLLCATKKRTHKGVRYRGAEKRIRAFSGAPRSDVINVVLCRRVYRNPTAARQSVLLPQNGSSRAKLFFALGHIHAYLSAFTYLVPTRRY